MKKILLIALLAVANQTFAIQNRDARLLWGDTHPKAEQAEELFRLIGEVPGLTTEWNDLEAENTRQLQGGLRCSNNVNCEYRLIKNGIWKKFDTVKSQSLYSFFQNRLQQNKTIELDSIQCKKADAGTTGTPYFCSVSFVSAHIN